LVHNGCGRKSSHSRILGFKLFVIQQELVYNNVRRMPEAGILLKNQYCGKESRIYGNNRKSNF